MTKKYKVTAYSLHLRQEPKINGTVVGYMGKDEVVELISISGDEYWYKVLTRDGKTGWASHKYLAFISEPVPENSVCWLKIAYGEMGVKEFTGSADNPRIVEYFRSTTLPAPYSSNDETPWCSAFVNWCVEKSGYEGTDSAWARSWLNWGKKIDEPVIGCVAVFERGPDFGHVGFYVGKTDESIKVLGGNQSDAVNINSTSYTKERLLGFRMPYNYQPDNPVPDNGNPGSLNQGWLKTALQITGDFETSGNPWSEITGDFDGQGISCGVLQWNIGQGSLHSLVKAGGKSLVLRYMPVYGNALWNACNVPIPQGLLIVRSWQTSDRIKPEILTELTAFFGSPEMIEKQTERFARLGKDAYNLAKEWAKVKRNSQSLTLHEFCWFFDLLTLNGGMKNIWYQDVQDFIELHTPEKVDNIICDWLMNVPSTMHGYRDSRKNAELWRDKIRPEHLDLFVLGYLRAQKSKYEFRALVVNRRGTIATTNGYVNGEFEDLIELRS